MYNNYQHQVIYTSTNSQLPFCVCVVRTLKFYSLNNSPVYSNTLWSTVVSIVHRDPQNLLILQMKVSNPWATSPHFLHHPAPGNNLSTLQLYEFYIASFHTEFIFFCQAYFTEHIHSRFVHFVTNDRLLHFYGWILCVCVYIYIHTYIYIFIYKISSLFIRQHYGSFYNLAVVNNALMLIGGQILRSVYWFHFLWISSQRWVWQIVSVLH